MSQIDLLSDELQSLIESTNCFTAASGVRGSPQTTHATKVNPRLYDVVIAVVVLKNGEVFTGSTVCSKNAARNFELASQKAIDKAMRKFREHYSKHRQGTLI